ncbi:MAG: DMT family transporter [Rhodobacteraceae bacterium]|nr:DMT family transporter [Paracoccaceae bacterium]
MRDAQIQRRASLALVLGASVWGLYWLPLREMNRLGIEGTWGVVFFNFCPLLVLLPLMIWKRVNIWTSPGPALFIGLMTGVAMGIYSTAMVIAPVIRVTMEFYLTAVWSTIIGVIWLSERLDLRRVATVVAGLFGLFLLIAGASDAEQSAFGLGDVLALASGVLWAFGAAGMKRWPGEKLLATSFYQFVFAVLAGAVLAHLLFPGTAPAPTQLLDVLPLAFVGSAMLLLPSIMAIFWASRVLFPGRAAILMMSEALVATVSATLLLPEETMTLMQWTGGAIVLLACLLGS